MIIVSFSGIDGAGKSTQISELEAWLRASGLRTKLVTFWDDIVVLSRWREVMSHRVFNGDQGIGTPERPLHRRDKNVSSRPLTLARLFLYLGDTLSLRFHVHAIRKDSTDVVIFDRYIYDELANLPLDKAWVRAFVWLMLKLSPQPGVAYLIDADPITAVARKPEYPLEFVCRNRESYLTLANMAGDLTIVEPGSVNAVQRRIKQEMLRELWTGDSTFAVSS